MSLEKMPMITWLQTNRHVLKSGKAIANVDHHTVPTGLVKARRFLEDKYLEDIESVSDSRYFSLKGSVAIVSEKATVLIICKLPFVSCLEKW